MNLNSESRDNKSKEYINMESRKDELITVYTTLSNEKLDYVNRKWETIKTATSLTIGLFAGAGAILAIFPENILVKIAFGFLLLVISPAISLWSFINVKRESELQFFSEFSLYQIEKLWGLHNQVEPNSCWLPDYPFLFERKHRDYKFNSLMELDQYKENPPLAWAKSRVRKQEFLRINIFLNILSSSASIILGVIILCLP